MLSRLAIMPLLAATMLFGVDIPRKAPEFVIQLPDGGQKLLSDFRGKVVCVEFLFTTCPHCQRSSQMLTQLQKEYGARGFQPIGIAFNPMSKMLVKDFVRDYKVGFPVGYAEDTAVKPFLQVPVTEGLHVPQLVFIDRNGMIRKQSLPRGDNATGLEFNVRKTIEELLAEKGAAAPAKSKAKPARKTS